MYKYKQKINPRTGKVDMVYRIIMENYIGRPLESDEIVHHIDGDPSNNDISNLQLMSCSEHGKLHQSNKRMHIICPICNKKFDIKPSQYKKRSKHSTSPVCCSRTCAGKFKTPPNGYKHEIDPIIMHEYKNGLNFNQIAIKHDLCRTTVMKHIKKLTS